MICFTHFIFKTKTIGFTLTRITFDWKVYFATKKFSFASFHWTRKPPLMWCWGLCPNSLQSFRPFLLLLHYHPTKPSDDLDGVPSSLFCPSFALRDPSWTQDIKELLHSCIDVDPRPPTCMHIHTDPHMFTIWKKLTFPIYSMGLQKAQVCLPTVCSSFQQKQPARSLSLHPLSWETK